MVLEKKQVFQSKKSFEIPFTLIFGIIAGVIILLLAIYGTSKLINSSQQVQYSEAAKSLLNLLNPIVNDIETTYVPKPLSFNKETRIYLSCSLKSEKSPVFGKQTLAFSEQSAFLKKWPEPGVNISRYNKYIFAERMEQGKALYIFSKPFYLGYRVDDLIILSMNNFCFVNAPAFLIEEIQTRGYKNINLTADMNKCSSTSKKICFASSSSNCDVSVYGQCVNECDEESERYSYGYVEKNGKTLSYTGNLLYAAIFSSPEIYECNLKRLGKKISELGKVYLDEINILAKKGCNTLISSNLNQLIAIGANVSFSSSFIEMQNYANQMDRQNCKDIMCRIYESSKC